MGQRHYEQKDHLGNVVATISDRRIAVDQYNYTTGTTHVASTVINTVDPTRLAYMYVGTGGTKAFALGTDDMADSWMPEVESYSDYYPFGMLMPGRNANSGDYSYGFQGQLKDDEIKGVGNSINFEYRMHDPRLGRFFAIDPLAAKYPYNSPYAFSENRVIDGVELEGLEVKLVTITVGTHSDGDIKLISADVVIHQDWWVTGEVLHFEELLEHTQKR